MKEEWRKIIGYEEFYEVSSIGRIRSFDRTIFREGNKPFVLPGRVLKTRQDAYGYTIVDLNAGSSPSTHKVHRLVAAAFIPNPDNHPQVDHIDGVRINANANNLRWVSVKQNALNKHHVKQSSGYRGVRLQRRPRGDRWQAYCHNHEEKRFVHIGVFDTAEEAFAARKIYINENSNVSAR